MKHIQTIFLLILPIAAFTQNIGIGTNNPAAKMEISSNGTLANPQLLIHENDNDYGRIRFDNQNGSNYWTITAYNATNYRNDRLNFWNGVGGDVMTITGDGEVGIGVGISPKTDLHVGNGRRVLFGLDTLGNGDKFMWLPDLHAFRVGTVATGAASTYWNRDSIGLYSMSAGFNTRAQGFGATAFGRDTEATNSYAFASGYFSNADGQYSTAMGFNTDAFGLGSTALGYSTDAEENYTTAMGHTAEAQAIYSVAIGNRVLAQSYNSMAVGRYNVGGGSATTWISTDPIFEIGIGSSSSAKANAMTVRKNGNVGIGTTSPSDRLHVANGKLRIGSFETLEDGGSFILQTNANIQPETDNTRALGSSTNRFTSLWATDGSINTSDRRDKTNIEALNYGLNEVMKLQPVSFHWESGNSTSRKLGLVAQDLLQVLPEVVVTHQWVSAEDDNTPGALVATERLGVYYSDIIPVLINAIQEQQVVVDDQKALIGDLIQRIEALESVVAEIDR